MRIKSTYIVLLSFLLVLFIAIDKCYINAEESLKPIFFSNNSYNPINDLSITTTEDGYITVSNYMEQKTIYIEKFDFNYDILSVKTIPVELDKYGGCYFGENANYLVFGNDGNGIIGQEILRVDKYDKSWNKIGSGSYTTTGLSLAEGHIGSIFDMQSLDMTESEGILYIATSHNSGHQGFLLYEVDEEKMDISCRKGDYMHSFKQCIEKKDKDNIYILEFSEGYYCSKLTNLNMSKTVSVFDYNNRRTSNWACDPYATADDLALSDHTILSVGQSVDQSRIDDESYDKSQYNVYVSVTDMDVFLEDCPVRDIYHADSKYTKVKWITSDNERKRDIKLIKINDNRFVLMWSNDTYKHTDNDDYNDTLSYCDTHYVFLDAEGNTISKEYIINASLSTCEPIVSKDKIVFYNINYVNRAFYSIDVNSGEFNKYIFSTAGDGCSWNIEGDTLYITGTGRIKDDFLHSIYTANLKNLHIYDGITEIGKHAFSSPPFKSVRIPSSVKVIDDYAFEHVNNLVFYIGRNVTSIGNEAFLSFYDYYDDDKPYYLVTIYCEKDSYIYNYCIKNKINHLLVSAKLNDYKKAEENGKIIKIDDAKLIGTTGNVSYVYYTDPECTQKTKSENGAETEGGAPSKAGKYYVKAYVEPDDLFGAVVSNTAILEIYNKNKKTEEDYTEPNTQDDENTVVQAPKTAKEAKKITVKSVKLSKGKKKIKVKWSKFSNIKKYQIQIATNKRFTKGKKSVKTSKTTYTFKKLKSKKKYYIRVRSVCKVNGKTIYGKWSKVKSIKTK